MLKEAVEEDVEFAVDEPYRNKNKTLHVAG